jgi:hypothetical protein
VFGPPVHDVLSDAASPRRSLPAPTRTGVEYVAPGQRGESVGVLRDELGEGCTDPSEYVVWTSLRMTGLGLSPHDRSTILREIDAALGGDGR